LSDIATRFSHGIIIGQGAVGDTKSRDRQTRGHREVRLTPKRPKKCTNETDVFPKRSLVLLVEHPVTNISFFVPTLTGIVEIHWEKICIFLKLFEFLMVGRGYWCYSRDTLSPTSLSLFVPTLTGIVWIHWENFF